MLAITLGALLAGIGCSQPQRSVSAPMSGAAHEFAPTRVRIHPLTRLAPGSGDAPPRIDAHLELLDRWGVPVRALGELRFIARLDESDVAPARQRDPGFEGAVTWTIDMFDPQANATQYYDRVTRTYHIALSHPILSEARAPIRLDVLFEAPEVAALSASVTLQAPKP